MLLRGHSKDLAQTVLWCHFIRMRTGAPHLTSWDGRVRSKSGGDGKWSIGVLHPITSIRWYYVIHLTPMFRGIRITCMLYGWCRGIDKIPWGCLLMIRVAASSGRVTSFCSGSFRELGGLSSWQVASGERRQWFSSLTAEAPGEYKDPTSCPRVVAEWKDRSSGAPGVGEWITCFTCSPRRGESTSCSWGLLGVGERRETPCTFEESGDPGKGA